MTVLVRKDGKFVQSRVMKTTFQNSEGNVTVKFLKILQDALKYLEEVQIGILLENMRRRVLNFLFLGHE